MSIVVTYQYFIRQLDQELLAERIQQEKALSENLVKKLKKTGQQDSEWEQQVLSQSSQQKKLNVQQASLLERQRNEIDELNSILEQREQVVRQFQLEKTSTQEQINNLQLKVRSVQQQLQSVHTWAEKSLSPLSVRSLQYFQPRLAKVPPYLTSSPAPYLRDLFQSAGCTSCAIGHRIQMKILYLPFHKLLTFRQTNLGRTLCCICHFLN